VPVKARRGSRSVREVDVPLAEAEAGGRNTNDGDKRDDKLPRNVILYDERIGPLHRITYVHFGV
jgi:hypothetical protein